MTLRVVIADDHTVVLHGLRAILALEEDLEIVAVCTDGLEAIEAVEAHRPDLLVIDSMMPRCEGLEAVTALEAKGLRVPTIVLAAALSDETVLRCLEAGVEGIVLKEAAAAALVDAIRTVARGERWIPGELATRVLDLLPGRSRASDELTPREREIVILVAAGASNKRAAAQLGIAESTVKLHLHSAFTKLDVSNRVQLSLIARDRGWI